MVFCVRNRLLVPGFKSDKANIYLLKLLSYFYENNPYRERSELYWCLGLLSQITTGKISCYINAENLLNVRPTKEDYLLLPEQSPSGWTTDLWSRNDGFTVNAGLRYQFGE